MEFLTLFDKENPKGCLSEKVNHPLDPVEYSCGYDTTINCDECKYNGIGGKEDPEAECNQL